MAAAVKYMHENADKHGIDKDYISIRGQDGGAWVTLGCALMLVRENNQHLVKTVWLESPMLSCEIIHDDFNDANLVPSEHFKKQAMSDIMRVLVTDYDNMFKNHDPLLFPGWMSQEEMQKLPGVILQTAEWDMFRFDAHAIIPKLKQAGVYLDHADYDVDGHGVQEMP